MEFHREQGAYLPLALMNVGHTFGDFPSNIWQQHEHMNQDSALPQQWLRKQAEC